MHLSERRWLLHLGDVGLSVVTAFLSLGLWTLSTPEGFSWGFITEHWYWIALLPIAWTLINMGLSDLQRNPLPMQAMREMLATALIASMIYSLIFFLAPRNSLPRLMVFYFVASAFVVGFVWRLLYLAIFLSPYFQRRLLIVGAGRAGRELIATLQQFQAAQFAVVGVIDDDPTKHDALIEQARILGGHEKILSAVNALRVSEIVLAITGELDGETFQTLLDCQTQGVPIVRMTALYEEITGRVPLEHLDADWVTASFMDQSRRQRLFEAVKRLADISLACLGLVVLGVGLPLIALAIKLASPGPIFYRQTRLGRGGRPFTIYKFRSMVAEAEADGKARWASEDDERVTSVGRWLRKTRLDEAPQFWNILMGDMSLIGPRPERPEFIAELEHTIPFYRARLLVKPGLTGWAQVNYGYGATVADAALKLQWDLYYIKNRSLWLETLIFWHTFGVVVAFRGT